VNNDILEQAPYIVEGENSGNFLESPAYATGYQNMSKLGDPTSKRQMAARGLTINPKAYKDIPEDIDLDVMMTNEVQKPQSSIVQEILEKGKQGLSLERAVAEVTGEDGSNVDDVEVTETYATPELNEEAIPLETRQGIQGTQGTQLAAPSPQATIGMLERQIEKVTTEIVTQTITTKSIVKEILEQAKAKNTPITEAAALVSAMTTGEQKEKVTEDLSPQEFYVEPAQPRTIEQPLVDDFGYNFKTMPIIGDPITQNIPVGGPITLSSTQITQLNQTIQSNQNTQTATPSTDANLYTPEEMDRMLNEEANDDSIDNMPSEFNEDAISDFLKTINDPSKADKLVKLAEEFDSNRESSIESDIKQILGDKVERVIERSPQMSQVSKTNEELSRRVNSIHQPAATKPLTFSNSNSRPSQAATQPSPPELDIEALNDHINKFMQGRAFQENISRIIEEHFTRGL